MSTAGVPVITDVQRACQDPELAILSAIAHGRDADPALAALIGYAAQCASETLDEDRRQQYLDIILDALSEGARRALQAMDPAKYQYRSEFARGYFAQGEAKGLEEGEARGEARGRADLLTRQLTRRFGPPPNAARQRLASASIDELDAIGERLLTADTLQEALGES